MKYLVLILLLVSIANAQEYKGFNVELNFAHGSGNNFEHVKENIGMLADLGFNIVRLQIYTGFSNNKKIKWTAESEQDWVTRVYHNLNDIEKLRELIEEKNLKFILDIHDMPSSDVFTNAKWKDAFLNTYSSLVSYGCNSQSYLGIDINEPEASGYYKILPKLMDIINQTCPQSYMIVEPVRGSPLNINDIPKLKGNHITSVHHYAKSNVTHQGLKKWGIKSKYESCKVYPSKSFDEYDLRISLNKVRSYQLKRKEKIYIGEFGIVRTSGCNKNRNSLDWINDSVNLFKKYGWSYSYLEFRAAGNNDFWDVLYRGHNFNDREPYLRHEILQVLQ